MSLALLSLLLVACSTSPHWAADRREDLRRAIVDGRLDDAEQLLERHGSVLPASLALDLSVRHGELDAIRRFLRVHPVNKAIDTDGASALIRAATDTPANKGAAVITLLIESGADPLQSDLGGRNAIDYVRDRQEPAMLEAMRQASTQAASVLPEPVRRTDWLPPTAWNQAQADTAARDKLRVLAEAGKDRKRGASRASRRPDRSRVVEIGAPWWLTADTWLPSGEAQPTSDGSVRVDGSTDPWVWAGLRFDADGTGALLSYDANSGRAAKLENSFIAWDAYRGQASFFVLTPGFASHCRTQRRDDRHLAVECDDFAIRGQRWRPAPEGLLSQLAARQLLDNAGERAQLPATGRTRSVLRADASSLCRPQASRSRDRKRSTSVTRKPGSWHVYDRKLNVVFAPGLPQVCAQTTARRVARRACNASGARACVDLGGCPANQASAVAGRHGHDWAWLACANSAFEARRQALQTCREKSGCDCQLLAANDRVSAGVCTPPGRR